MKVERFDSELGEVAITEEHIERRRSESGDWDRITEEFDEEKLVDSVSFSRIDDLELKKGSIFPNIRFLIDDDWKRMFFHDGDDVEECFKRLKYRISIYSQIY